MTEFRLSHELSEFNVLAEISVIAHLADNLFASVLPDGLTTAQFGVLNYLLRLDTQQTISEIASALQVSQPTMSSTVKKLEQKGFTRRLSSPSDGRAKYVHVTNMGRRAWDQSAESLANLQPKFMSPARDIAWDAVLPQLKQISMMLCALSSSQE